MVGPHWLIAGKLHYGLPSSVMISSISQWRQLTILKGIQLPRGEFWILTHTLITALLSPCNANHVTLLPVSSLSLVLHILPEWTSLPLQKKSKIWLVIWFTRNTLIWHIKTTCSIALCSSLSLYKGPRDIGNCFWQYGLVFIFFKTVIHDHLYCTPLEIKCPVLFHSMLYFTQTCLVIAKNDG